MEYFMDTSETIPSGMGFTYFDIEHWIWLCISILLSFFGAAIYKKAGTLTRRKFRCSLAWGILGTELYKQLMLFVGRRWLVCYLPFHLCSLNVFFVLYHAFRPNQVIGNYLYGVSLPAAAAALLFPGWEDLPAMNFMYLHSWALHILLVIYPVSLLAGGDISPNIKDGLKAMAILTGMAVVFGWLNEFLYDRGMGVNFFFLRTVSPNNPLYIFKKLWGNHLLGLPIVLIGVFSVMYFPGILIVKVKNRRSGTY